MFVSAIVFWSHTLIKICWTSWRLIYNNVGSPPSQCDSMTNEGARQPLLPIPEVRKVWALTDGVPWSLKLIMNTTTEQKILQSE